MFKTIFATTWILAAMAALYLGLNRSIDPVAMMSFSLVALGLLYASAIVTVIAKERGSRMQASGS